jgi:hypothetical protein
MRFYQKSYKIHRENGIWASQFPTECLLTLNKLEFNPVADEKDSHMKRIINHLH